MKERIIGMALMRAGEMVAEVSAAPVVGAVSWVSALLIVAFLLISVMMILVILIQKPQGGGLSGAFGSGSGSGQTAFGARTGDALTIATIGIFVVFVGMAAGLNFAIKPPKAVPVTPAVAAPGGAGEPGGQGEQSGRSAPSGEKSGEGTGAPEATKPVDPGQQGEAGQSSPK